MIMNFTWSSLSYHDNELYEPSPTAGTAHSGYRPISAPVASTHEAAAAHRLSPAISVRTIFYGRACLPGFELGSLPLFARPDARLSGGKVGWGGGGDLVPVVGLKLHPGHGAPLARTVDSALPRCESDGAMRQATAVYM